MKYYSCLVNIIVSELDSPYAVTLKELPAEGGDTIMELEVLDAFSDERLFGRCFLKTEMDTPEKILVFAERLLEDF